MAERSGGVRGGWSGRATPTRRQVLAGGLFLGFMGGSVRADDPKPYDPTSAYEPREIEGWTVRVHRRLIQERDLCDRVLRLTAHQLYQTAREVPEGPLKRLRQIPIWVERHHPRHPCACYHADRSWLIANGFNPDKTGAVEIANPENFLSWSRQQPWMLLHELAHGYHDQVLTFEEPRIKAAHAAMVKGGRYESVLHINGSLRRHYALTNPTEYFAESTEAFFGTNDFYPFVRAELEKHDPEMHRLLQEIWEVPQGRR